MIYMGIFLAHFIKPRSCYSLIKHRLNDKPTYLTCSSSSLFSVPLYNIYYFLFIALLIIMGVSIVLVRLVSVRGTP